MYCFCPCTLRPADLLLNGFWSCSGFILEFFQCWTLSCAQCILWCFISLTWSRLIGVHESYNLVHSDLDNTSSSPGPMDRGNSAIIHLNPVNVICQVVKDGMNKFWFCNRITIQLIQRCVGFLFEGDTRNRLKKLDCRDVTSLTLSFLLFASHVRSIQGCVCADVVPTGQWNQLRQKQTEYWKCKPSALVKKWNNLQKKSVLLNNKVLKFFSLWLIT